MHTFSIAACAAALLHGQALAVRTWKVSFWSGEYCTSAPVRTDEGPEYPQLSQVCNTIPDLGFTQAFDYEVASGDYTYLFGLHKASDCSDTGGRFQGSPDQPICESTAGGFTHYSIQTIAAISKRTDVNEALDVAESGLESADVEDGLEKRQVISFATMALAAIIPAANRIDKANTRCSKSTKATDTNVESNESCAIAATWSVFFSLVTAFGAFCVYRAQQKARDVSALNEIFTLGDVAEWIADPLRQQDEMPDLVEGFSTDVRSLGTVMDDAGQPWMHFHWNHTDKESGNQFGTLLKYHKATGDHIMQSEPTHAMIGKRAAQRYTAYYGWNHGADVQSLPANRYTADKLAEQVWNFGKKKGKDQFCANLRGGVDGSSFTRELTHGNFALLSGVFSDKKGKCPG